MQAAHVLTLQGDHVIYFMTFACLLCQLFGLFVEGKYGGGFRPARRSARYVRLTLSSLHDQPGLIRSAPGLASCFRRLADFWPRFIGGVTLARLFAESITRLTIKPTIPVAFVVCFSINAALIGGFSLPRCTARSLGRFWRVPSCIINTALALVAHFAQAGASYASSCFPMSHRKCAFVFLQIAALAHLFHNEPSHQSPVVRLMYPPRGLLTT